MAKQQTFLPGVKQPFTSVKAVGDFLLGLRCFYADGEPVTHKAHIDVLSYAIEQHPGRDEIIGTGVDHFTFETPMLEGYHRPKHGVDARGVSVVRTDGSKVPVRIVRGFEADPRRKQVHTWFRAAITGDMDQARAKYCEQFGDGATAPCQQSGQVTHISEIDVDHCGGLHFVSLVAQFVETNQTTFEQIATSDTYDKWADGFRAFHRDRAMVRFLSKTAHQTTRPDEHEYASPLKDWLG